MDTTFAINTKDLTAITPIERVIIYNENTNQKLLSIILNTEVKVEVISQIEVHGLIIRWVKLYIEKINTFMQTDKITVCLAESIIFTKYEGFKTGIIEKRMGIGELLSALKINTERKILGIYVDNNMFTRTYSLRSINGDIIPDIDITITEVFPKAVFNAL